MSVTSIDVTSNVIAFSNHYFPGLWQYWNSITITFANKATSEIHGAASTFSLILHTEYRINQRFVGIAASAFSRTTKKVRNIYLSQEGFPASPLLLSVSRLHPTTTSLGKEAFSTLQRFTIEIFGSCVKTHEVS